MSQAGWIMTFWSFIILRRPPEDLPRIQDSYEILILFMIAYLLEKEMATHSSVLAWRIPGMGEPSGLPSMGLQSQTRLKWLSSSSRRNSLAEEYEASEIRGFLATPKRACTPVNNDGESGAGLATSQVFHFVLTVAPERQVLLLFAFRAEDPEALLKP